MTRSLLSVKNYRLRALVLKANFESLFCLTNKILIKFQTVCSLSCQKKNKNKGRRFPIPFGTRHALTPATCGGVDFYALFTIQWFAVANRGRDMHEDSTVARRSEEEDEQILSEQIWQHRREFRLQTIIGGDQSWNSRDWSYPTVIGRGAWLPTTISPESIGGRIITFLFHSFPQLRRQIHFLI